VRVAIDLGCIPRNGAESLPILAWEYSPDVLYGFDPGDALEEGEFQRGGMKVVLRRAAAWTHDGTVMFHEDGSGSRVSSEYGVEIPCIDFSKWLEVLKLKGKADEIFVKMDIEGAEVPVLEKMIADGTDALVDELLVEWHGQTVDGFRCPSREWWL
jgi:FkbM family methyltransferase